jgi:hypothetical protein
MKKFILTLFMFAVAAIVVGCAGQPEKSGNSADGQRTRAEKAQGELSREVGR